MLLFERRRLIMEAQRRQARRRRCQEAVDEEGCGAVFAAMRTALDWECL